MQLRVTDQDIYFHTVPQSCIASCEESLQTVRPVNVYDAFRGFCGPHDDPSVYRPYCDVHRVSQEIFIERDNELTPLWVATQSGIDEIPEYSKKLSFLNCQMTAPHVVFEFKNQKNKHRNFVAQSICRWEEDFLPYKLLKNGKQYRINNYDLTDLTEI